MKSLPGPDQTHAVVETLVWIMYDSIIDNYVADFFAKLWDYRTTIVLILLDYTAAVLLTDPVFIYHYRDSLYVVDLISVALSVDFFSWLGGWSALLEEICAHFGYQSCSVDVMLTLFAANGWVEEREGIFQLILTVREYLCADSEWFLGLYYVSLHDRSIVRDFLEVLRTDKSVGWSGDKVFFDWYKAME
jgi:hypothetical protein